MIRINERVSIPEDELTFEASRSGGPGGQHVNKVSSRVILRFDLDGSPSLTDEQKRRIHRRLPTRITRDGRLWLACGTHRSQRANRREAVERFRAILREALERRRVRRRTTVPAAERRRRLDQKRRRSVLKRGRGRVTADD